ncbi:hypothetical protein BDV26DRAFT_125329 [Aspergillus bertholletiae]|uniref:Uncharacterized protein n=1 Tax=Aspergillus bertholletiae TaxID=1226010 RepID=A0A5N7APB6_9EURO|nr:hypothetical protein BDV26DRAFT_125329 [Aspergillus bertholletiae]
MGSKLLCLISSAVATKTIITPKKKKISPKSGSITLSRHSRINFRKIQGIGEIFNFLGTGGAQTCTVAWPAMVRFPICSCWLGCCERTTVQENHGNSITVVYPVLLLRAGCVLYFPSLRKL